MKEKSISFKPDLILGLLSTAYTQSFIGYRDCISNICPKTETRRLVKPQPYSSNELPTKPLYEKGQILWVREPWYAGKIADDKKPSELDPECWLKTNGGLWYQACNTKAKTPLSEKGRYRHARFMPRWASRITLEVTQDAYIENLKNITLRGAVSEGYPGLKRDPGQSARDWFMNLWETLYGNDFVYQNPNPYVWVIKFKINNVREWL